MDITPTTKAALQSVWNPFLIVLWRYNNWFNAWTWTCCFATTIEEMGMLYWRLSQWLWDFTQIEWRRLCFVWEKLGSRLDFLFTQKLHRENLQSQIDLVLNTCKYSSDGLTSTRYLIHFSCQSTIKIGKRSVDKKPNNWIWDPIEIIIEIILSRKISIIENAKLFRFKQNLNYLD